MNCYSVRCRSFTGTRLLRDCFTMFISDFASHSSFQTDEKPLILLINY